MSGGAMNYFYSKIRYLVDEVNMDTAEFSETQAFSPIEMEFIGDYADLQKEKEWWLSGDTDEEDYRKTLNGFLLKWVFDKRSELKQIAYDNEKKLNELAKKD